VFSPAKWAGVIVLGLGAVLYMTSGVMLRRGGGAEAGSGRAADGRGGSGGASKAASKGAVEDRKAAVDPDLAEIEQILKNRGIS
jgi:hypothetical protein